jgi:hypothetical protein
LVGSWAQADQVVPINPAAAENPRKRLRDERLTGIERES